MSLWGQKEVTTFMDIPIDGPVESFISDLQKKGFKYMPENNYKNAHMLEGVFNGQWAQIAVLADRNKVLSVGVIINVEGAENAKLQFNSLHAQMARNWKYYNCQEPIVPFIADDVDIEHELRYKKTDFRASFFQVLTNSAQVKALKEWKKSLGSNPDNHSIEEKDKELFGFYYLTIHYCHTSHITENLKHKNIEEMDSLELAKISEEYSKAADEISKDMEHPDFYSRIVSIALHHHIANHYVIHLLYTNACNTINDEDL